MSVRTALLSGIPTKFYLIFIHLFIICLFVYLFICYFLLFIYLLIFSFFIYLFIYSLFFNGLQHPLFRTSGFSSLGQEAQRRAMNVTSVCYRPTMPNDAMQCQYQRQCRMQRLRRKTLRQIRTPRIRGSFKVAFLSGFPGSARKTKLMTASHVRGEVVRLDITNANADASMAVWTRSIKASLLLLHVSSSPVCRLSLQNIALVSRPDLPRPFTLNLTRALHLHHAVHTQSQWSHGRKVAFD
jgi:hypothetical protein